MTQQEFMNYLNRLTVGYRLTWEDIKYDADKAIHKINDYLGACYPEISEVMTAPHHTYSIISNNKKIPIFHKRYLLSIVIPYVASEVLARDEEFTTIYNKYLVEVEEGLYNMFQNEFNKVPYMFRQSRDEGVFFAVDHPLHKTSVQKQNIPIIKFRVYYHINNEDIHDFDLNLFDPNAYNYGDEVTLIEPDRPYYINYNGTVAYEFKGWSYEPIDIAQNVTELNITSDTHLYAIWDRYDTLEPAANGGFKIKNAYVDSITRLVIPKYIGTNYITNISEFTASARNLKYIELPSSSITLEANVFNSYTGILVFPKYDYLRATPNITIKPNAIGSNVYTYVKDGVNTLYLPCSVHKIEAGGVSSMCIDCEYTEEPDNWDEGWCSNTADVEWGKSNG